MVLKELIEWFLFFRLYCQKNKNDEMIIKDKKIKYREYIKNIFSINIRISNNKNCIFHSNSEFT